jgi:cytochrome c556
MQRSFVTGIVGVLALGLSSLAAAQPSAPGQDPSWTGVTHPKDMIAAREELMLAIERIMEPIDGMEVSPQNPDTVRFAAARISELLLALPHLFPPTTNLYDPKAKPPETLALPAIWQNFPNFYQLAAAASTAAHTLADTRGTAEQMDQAGDALRDTCDACHALYLLPYHPSTVTQEDLNFDFDSVLKKTHKN